MRNVKNAKGKVIGRVPKHTEGEITAISGRWVKVLGGGLEFIPGYTPAQLRRRSKNRVRNRIAKASRRRNRQ